MRNLLIIVFGVLLLNGVFLYSGGFEYIKNYFEPKPVAPQLPPSVVDTFKHTLEMEVQEQMGMPVEGYEPAMFLEVFPGLVESDFEGVEASLGFYALKDGRLTLEVDKTQLVHSAAGAITRRGMERLYRNVATRAGIDIENGGTLTAVMSVVTAE